MIKIHRPEDLEQLNHLENKKKILARFVLNGCPACENSQPEWDLFSKRKSDYAIAEIEESFQRDFQDRMAKRGAQFDVHAYPTILMIHASSVKPISLKTLTRKRIKRKRKTRR
jgi:hypothetical protein